MKLKKTINNMSVLSKNSLNKLDGVNQRLVDVIKKAIVNTPIDFAIVQGLRTAEYQNELYQQGRTKPGKIVTNADGYKIKSNHQAKEDGTGWAIDFCPYIDEELDWDNTNNFKIIAEHILDTGDEMGIKLGWGGNWNAFKDLPHIELNWEKS